MASAGTSVVMRRKAWVAEHQNPLHHACSGAPPHFFRAGRAAYLPRELLQVLGFDAPEARRAVRRLGVSKVVDIVRGLLVRVACQGRVN